MSPRRDGKVEALEVVACTVPTDQPEADGTLAWDSTTVVIVRAHSEGCTGTGWTYAGGGAAGVVRDQLSGTVVGHDAMDVPGANLAMARAVRNLGRPGLAACAISAVDTALWDLKSRLLQVSLASLFGRCRSDVPIYGSGGFTTYDDSTTEAQVRTWVQDWGIPRLKIKIGESRGSCVERDLHRVALVRRCAGPAVEVFVDANGAYQRKQAIRIGRIMAAEHQVTWFEEPVSSDDLVGLRQVRDHCEMDVAAGEYGYDPAYFARMVAAGAVDCLQVDVTRCGGYTEWLRAAALAGAAGLEVSGHCAPNLHAPVAAAVPNLRHLEYFHDHHRIENMLFEGALDPDGGVLTPRPDSAGHGMEIRPGEVARYRVA